MTKRKIAIFGEVLFDSFPDGKLVLGGAPFNVAWHLQALGLEPLFIGRVGSDKMGEKIKQSMLDWGLVSDQLQTDIEHPTGVVQVLINNGEPYYNIVNNQAYDFIEADLLDIQNQYSVIYHGTLAVRNNVSAHTLKLLTAGFTGKVFVDVNLREPWWQIEQVCEYIRQAHWLKLNRDEFEIVQTHQGSLYEAMTSFLVKYKLEVLVVTCGDQGAVAINNSGQFVEVKPGINQCIVDTVGAGDAFAAVLLLGLHHGWSLSVTMNRAQCFASAMVRMQGATVSDPGFYLPFSNSWQLSV